MIKGLASPAVAILIVNGAASYATATLDGRDYLNHVVVPWQASAQTLAHELGHALFGLGDEYGSPHDDRCWPKLPFETVAGDPDVAVPNLTIAQEGTRWSGVPMRVRSEARFQPLAIASV